MRRRGLIKLQQLKVTFMSFWEVFYLCSDPLPHPISLAFVFFIGEVGTKQEPNDEVIR